ncbi:10195_t:CDS:2, partial [Paraglomus brasilianum]
KPAASTHLLAVPKAHIPTVKDLRAKHAGLLKHMLDTGHELLKDAGYTQDQIRSSSSPPLFRTTFRSYAHWDKIYGNDTLVRGWKEIV